MSTFVGGLVDPDPPPASETVDGGLDVIVDPGDARPDGPLRHPQQLTRCTLRCPHGEPGRHRVEVAGMTHVVSRPRNLSDCWAMGSALDALGTGFDKHFACACVESSPMSPTSPR